MKIRVLAFATAAEALGGREFEWEVEEGATVAHLLARMTEKAPNLTPIRDRLAVAMNGQLVGLETTLEDSAEVALLPPVSGGDALPAAQLVRRAIEPGEISRSDRSCGAEVVFLGRVRDHSDGKRVLRINYQGYEAMAEATLLAICRELSRDGTQLRIVHRLGDVRVGELSVAIAAQAPHRREAFTACSKALERLKRETPIWKQEHYEDGSLSWREEEPLSNGKPASTA